jgi:hypothetical protein
MIMTSPPSLSLSSRLRVVLGTRPHLRHFTVLALESSADDTCAAVVTSSGQILSNVVLKQNYMYVSLRSKPSQSSPFSIYRHEPFGGIHPYRAVQAHQQNMVRSPSIRLRWRWSLNSWDSQLLSGRH